MRFAVKTARVSLLVLALALVADAWHGVLMVLSLSLGDRRPSSSSSHHLHLPRKAIVETAAARLSAREESNTRCCYCSSGSGIAIAIAIPSTHARSLARLR